MKSIQKIRGIFEKIFENVKTFPTCKEVEITGEFLNMEIIGSDRKNIKIKILNQKQRKSSFHPIESCYLFSFEEKDEKLMIGSMFKARNNLIDGLWPTERCSLVVELPRSIAVSVVSNGVANLKITDVQGKLKLDVTSTAINLFGTRDVKAIIEDQSWLIMSSLKADSADFQISSTSRVNILTDAEIERVEAVIEGDCSSLESDGKIGDASIFLGGGCKLRIKKIRNNPMIVGMENKKNDVKIMEVGV